MLPKSVKHFLMRCRRVILVLALSEGTKRLLVLLTFIAEELLDDSDEEDCEVLPLALVLVESGEPKLKCMLVEWECSDECCISNILYPY